MIYMHPAKCHAKNGAISTMNYLLQSGQQKEKLKKTSKTKMNFTHDQLTKMGYKKDEHGNYSRSPKIIAAESMDAKVSNAKPKPNVRKALDTPAQAKAKSQGRFIVCITRLSCQPLDADNFAGGCKPLIDQLRYANLIPDDNPDCVELQFKQVKVSSKDQEGTEVYIKQI